MPVFSYECQPESLFRMHGLHLATEPHLKFFFSHRQNLILALLCFSGMLEWQCEFEFEKQVYHPPAEHHIFSLTKKKQLTAHPFLFKHIFSFNSALTQPTSQSVSTHSPFSPHSQNPSTKNPSVYREPSYT